uniref:Uncharacterized protein n=1 Tax=Oryza glumipatula TaxID=40148 RepID=A0A0E0A5F9_9ORYZ
MDETDKGSSVQVSELADDPEPRCMSLEETKQLIGYMNTIVDSLLKIVDSGYSPYPVEEIHEIIRDIREEGCAAVRRSLDQIRRDLDADDGGGGGENCSATGVEEDVGGVRQQPNTTSLGQQLANGSKESLTGYENELADVFRLEYNNIVLYKKMINQITEKTMENYSKCQNA